MQRWIMASAATILLAGCGDQPLGTTARRQAAPVATMLVRAVSWRDTLEAIGTARARESVTLTAKVSETVTHIGFESGERVEAGKVLVRLSSAEQTAALHEARATYLESERLLALQNELVRNQLVAASQVDAQRAERDVAHARMDVVEAQLAQRVIVAPFAGLLGLRRISQGTVMMAGTPIVTLDDISRIKVDFPIPETHLAALARGQSIIVRSAAYPDREYTGTVAGIDSRVDAVTRAVMVLGEVSNSDGVLRPGMLLNVQLLQAERQALVVPEIAVVQSGVESLVFRVRGDGTAERLRVRLGVRRNGEVEIVEGVGAGDHIVVDGALRLFDGMKVSERSDKAIELSRTPPVRQGVGRTLGATAFGTDAAL